MTQLYEIEYKTSVLAKEVGFDIPVSKWYNIADPEYGTKTAAPMNHNYKPWGNVIVSAPTQDLLAAWIRDEYDIHVVVMPIGKPADYMWIMPEFKEHDNTTTKHTIYKSAFEQGLYAALEKIKERLANEV